MKIKVSYIYILLCFLSKVYNDFEVLLKMKFMRFVVYDLFIM